MIVYPWGAAGSSVETRVNAHPRVQSVNVGAPRDYIWLGRPLRSSIDKSPVAGPVRVLADHLEGDQQSDLNQHGGPDKSVYAYSAEDYAWWTQEMAADVPPGRFGENLTTTGLDLRTAVIGEQWQIGSTVLQVSEPRTPCWKLGMRMEDKLFPRRFAAAGRPGVLLRVLQQGSLQAGDEIDVRGRPAHAITALDVFEAYRGDEVDVVARMAAPELAAHWREWVNKRTIWHLDEERRRRELNG